MKVLASSLFSLISLFSTGVAGEITLTPKDGTGEPIVIDTSKKSEVTLEGKTYLVQPQDEPATIAKARAIIIPRIDFSETPLDEAVDYLTQKGIELDEKKSHNLNFVLKDVDDAVIPRLMLRNVPLFEVVGFLAELTGTQAEFREFAIVFTKK